MCRFAFITVIARKVNAMKRLDGPRVVTGAAFVYETLQCSSRGISLQSSDRFIRVLHTRHSAYPYATQTLPDAAVILPYGGEHAAAGQSAEFGWNSVFSVWCMRGLDGNNTARHAPDRGPDKWH